MLVVFTKPIKSMTTYAQYHSVMITKSLLETVMDKLKSMMSIRKRELIIFRDIMGESVVLTGQVDSWLVDQEMASLPLGI